MSSPWIGIPVLTFLAAAIMAAVYGLWRLGAAIRYEAREAQHTAAGIRHDPFADPADRTDPHGDNWPPAAGPDDGWGELYVPPIAMAPPGRLAMLPPDPDPDPTLVQPHDVKYLGKPSKVLVEEIFEKHAPKPEMLP